ncbi:hypothetical protein ABPG74_018964 [Tetrahymena malaccensis]
MDNQIILQASKSIEAIKQELQNNSQRTSISIQIQHIRQRSKQYLDLLAGHLKIQKHYQDVQITIAKNTLISDEGFQMLSQCLKCLKKVQILKLFLGESCQVGSQGLIYLSQAISNLKQLSDLTIILDSYNYVRNDGLVSLASIFSKLPNLVKLQIKIGQSNRYDDLGISVICKNLQLIKQLQILKFEIDGSKISKVGTQVIAETLEQLTNLENLDFMIEARLGKVEGAKDLAISIGQLVNLKFLKFSIIQENRICSEVSIELCKSLKKLQKLVSFLIKGFYPFQDKQTAVCYTEIFEQITQLKNMNLEIDCPQLQGAYTALCLANCLKNLTNLTDFEMSLCNDSNISDEGFSALSQAVKNMRNLKKLAISIDGYNKIGNTGAFSLGEALGELKQLDSIKLFLGNQNEISSEGARAIAGGIQKMSNLINLYVRINRSKQSNLIEITSFWQILSKLSNLEVLEYCFCSSITNLGAQAFAQGQQIQQQIFEETFQSLINLKKLVLYLTYPEMAMLIANSLKYLQRLEFLHFDYSLDSKYYSHEELKCLGKGLCYLTNLYEISLNIYILPIKPKPPIFTFRRYNDSYCRFTSYFPNSNFQERPNSNFQERPNSNFDEVVSGIKSIKNLEKFQTTIRNIDSQLMNALDCINTFENVQNIDLTLGEDSISETEIQIQYSEIISDDEIQVKNQQNLNYLSLTQLSISIKKMNGLQKNKLENFLSAISRYKNINTFSLIVQDSFLFTFQKFSLMCASLSNLSYLRDLTLSFQENNEIGSKSALCLANAFKSLPELELLSLQIANLNYIYDEGAYYLSKGIKSLINLRQFKFQLGGCNIQKQGAIYIGECLQCLINLRILFLEIEKDEICSEGAISIGNAIRYLTHLTELKIQIGESNKIYKVGACAFANGMQYLSNLKTLNLVINHSNYIESFGVSVICEALRKMNCLQVLNMDFGHNNMIMSSNIQEISYVIKSLNLIKSFSIIISVSNFTSNYCNEVVDMIKLIDPISIIFNFEINQSKIHHEISPNKQFQNKNLKIITHFEDSEYIFKSIFLPIQSIIQIPSVKQLQIKTNRQEDMSKKQCSILANIFNHLQSLEDLRLHFFKKGFGSFFECGKNLSQLTNLKHLTFNLQISYSTEGQFIQEIGQQLSQLHNLESFQFFVCELRAIDLLFLIKCISILQKLKFVKIIQDDSPYKIFKRNLLDQIARKVKRLVVFKVVI